jgi:hypothetical protein
MSIQFCGRCGHPLIPNQLFCQHCGERVDEYSTRAAAPVVAGMKAASGGPLYCGECGTLIGSQDTVCRRCGAPVAPAQKLALDPPLDNEPTVGGIPPFAPDARQRSTYDEMSPSSVSLHPAGTPASWASPAGYPAQARPLDDPPTFTTDTPLRPGSEAPAGQRRAIPAGRARPPFTPPGSAPSNQHGPRWPLVLAVVLVALALIAGGSVFLLLHQSNTGGQTNHPTATTAPITPSPTRVVLNGQTAGALIQQFYAYINNKQYDSAYDLLSQQYQQTQSRQNFDSGFQNTIQDTLTILKTATQSDGSVRVDVTLAALENKNGAQVTTNYAGFYIVIIEQGQLRIQSGHLDPQS